MFKTHYLSCKSLHSLPKFASKTQRIQVVLIVLDMNGHEF